MKQREKGPKDIYKRKERGREKRKKIEGRAEEERKQVGWREIKKERRRRRCGEMVMVLAYRTAFPSDLIG